MIVTSFVKKLAPTISFLTLVACTPQAPVQNPSDLLPLPGFSERPQIYFVFAKNQGTESWVSIPNAPDLEQQLKARVELHLVNDAREAESTLRDLAARPSFALVAGPGMPSQILSRILNGTSISPHRKMTLCFGNECPSKIRAVIENEELKSLPQSLQCKNACLKFSIVWSRWLSNELRSHARNPFSISSGSIKWEIAEGSTVNQENADKVFKVWLLKRLSQKQSP